MTPLDVSLETDRVAEAAEFVGTGQLGTPGADGQPARFNGPDGFGSLGAGAAIGVENARQIAPVVIIDAPGLYGFDTDLGRQIQFLFELIHGGRRALPLFTNMVRLFRQVTG